MYLFDTTIIDFPKLVNEARVRAFGGRFPTSLKTIAFLEEFENYRPTFISLGEYVYDEKASDEENLATLMCYVKNEFPGLVAAARGSATTKFVDGMLVSVYYAVNDPAVQERRFYAKDSTRFREGKEVSNAKLVFKPIGLPGTVTRWHTRSFRFGDENTRRWYTIHGSDL